MLMSGLDYERTVLAGIQLGIELRASESRPDAGIVTCLRPALIKRRAPAE